MATVQVRNVDEAAYEVLRQRAAASGRSLQEYLRLSLERLAAEPTISESLASVRADLRWSKQPSMDDIVDLQRADRDR
ncbi:FitA-like ribbon-helix-helix domain-containing protein [Nocardioides sp. Kera G14]|uniref:FitA-like ribbon-helix-helix domain-containing protein n=1 Tax=Nocardioides sp. Kera G14 TaxID=2884264 RepID=UPI001D0FA162|nr:hypothetical protein [Nocardioides sp. Kera G14]UDY23377.1 hypothetical protein LH076_15140 [Nocardioides sp. Kera G14]